MRYSYSMLDTFEQCPFKWSEVYVNKVPRLPDTPALIKGNTEHKVFEDVFAGRRDSVPLTDPYVPAVAALGNGREVRAEGTFGITRNGEISASTGWNSDCYLFGKIDLVLVGNISNKTIPTKIFPHAQCTNRDKNAYILDWKTGKPGYPKPFQLDIYSLFVLTAFRKTIEAAYSRLIYTSHQVFFPEGDGEWYKKTASDVPVILGEVHRRTDEIERAKRMNAFPKKPGPLCRYCPSIRCQESPNYAD